MVELLMAKEEGVEEEERRGLEDNVRLTNKQLEKRIEVVVERENNEEEELEQVVADDCLISTDVRDNDPPVMQTNDLVNGDGTIEKEEERSRTEEEEIT
jgi:hypothetical protein